MVLIEDGSKTDAMDATRGNEEVGPILKWKLGEKTFIRCIIQKWFVIDTQIWKLVPKTKIANCRILVQGSCQSVHGPWRGSTYL